MVYSVLVVDSSRQRRESFVENVLQPAGFQVLQADRANVARAQLADCDLVLAWQEPLDSLALLSGLRDTDRHKPVILVTEMGSEQLAVDAFRRGVSDYLSSPFSDDQLVNAIRSQLNGHSAEAISHHASHQRLMTSNLELSTYLHDMDRLIEVSKQITSGLDVEELLTNVVQAAATVVGADTASILLADENTGELYVRASHNLESGLADDLRLPLDGSLAGRAVQTGQPVFINSDEDQKIKTAYLVRSLAYLPLKAEDEVIGVLGVDNRYTNQRFSQSQIRLLGLLADFASIALHNAGRYRQMRYERDTLNAILAGTDEPVLVTDLENNVLLCNASMQAVFALPADYDGSVVDVIDHDALLHLLQAETGQRAELIVDDDRVFNAQVTLIPDVGRVIIMQDISYLKELDRLKTNFVANVSQDLRSPLTAIMGYVELLDRAGPLNDQQQLFIERIKLSGQSITNLITDLLDLSRIETGGVDNLHDRVWLRLVLQYALATVEGQIKAKKQRLVMEIDDDVPPLIGSPQRLKQMIRNLLQNAIQYTPENGTITVTLQAQADLAVLQVSDTGIGIPVDDQASIFDKFYRADNVRDKYEGAGLGLAIVKSIVDRHAGRIWVQSELNEGSTFTVILPTLLDK